MKSVMKRPAYLILFLLFLSVPAAKGQNVVLNADFDSLAICIGQQARMTLDLRVDTGYEVKMPDLRKDTLCAGIEIRGVQEKRSLIDNGKREKYVQEYLVTSFDANQYNVPAFDVYIDSVKYPSRSPELFVYNVNINTEKIDSISPVRDIIGVELGWEEYRDSVYLGVIVLFSVSLLVYLAILFIKNKPIIRIIKIKPKVPSHIQAMKAIDEIKNDPSLAAGENSKLYYTRLTDVLRQYLDDRFGINAMEMTTSEIVAELKKIEDKDALKDLQELFEMADLVKFAKMSVTMYDNNRNMLNAIEFVNRTKNVEEETIKQPTEKVIVNERTRRQKMILLVSIIVIALALVGLVYLFTTDLYNLFN